MFIAATLYVLFSFTLLIVNQIYKDLYYNENNPLIILISIISLSIGIFCYYKNYAKKKNTHPLN